MAFQTITCLVAVANDQNQKVAYGPHRPVTYPELLVIQHLHGEAAVYDARALGEIERSPREERDRLNRRYGVNVVNMLFPGVGARLPESDPNLPPYEGPGAETKKSKGRKAPAKKPEPEPAPDPIDEPPLAVEEEIAKEA